MGDSGDGIRLDTSRAVGTLKTGDSMIASFYTPQTWHFSTKKGDAYQPWVRVLLTSYYHDESIIVSIIICLALCGHMKNQTKTATLTPTAVPLDHWLVVTAQLP